MLTCGVGPDKAARRTAAALPLAQADAVVSLGTCGALADHLDTGDIVTAGSLHSGAAPCPPPLPWPDTPAEAIVTVAAPVWDPARRDALAATGATACEMEAAAVQAAAGDRRFWVLKVVSDHAGGDPDDPPARPGPAALARFMARALRLSQGPLLGALRAGLPATRGG